MVDLPARIRVLVADDNTNIRRIICLFLQNANYETIEARNGREALDLARTVRPELILLDVMMPLLDGFHICEQLKGHAGTKGIPIIVVTAKTRYEDVVTAIHAGADDYISKPFTRDSILQTLDRVLRRARNVSSSQALPAVERRTALRRPVHWAVSWGQTEQGGLRPAFKARLYDLSILGFSFVFRRCKPCTGYEEGTVHPLCLFARHARKLPATEPIEFIFSEDEKVLFQAQGVIAHVYQWPTPVETEKVGVAWTHIEAEHLEFVQGYLDRTQEA